MKIIGGEHKGRNFYMPKGLRPTQNMTRKAVFDLVGHDLDGIEFLELFAGSGAVGLEALSRGAKKVTFVESEVKCLRVIEANLELLGFMGKDLLSRAYEIIYGDAFAAIKRFAKHGRKFDMIFLDPPFGRGLAKKALKILAAYDILQPNCFVIVEVTKKEVRPDLDDKFQLVKQRRYGRAFLLVYQHVIN